MEVYYAQLIIIYISGLLTRVCKEKYKLIGILFIVVSLVTLILVSGLSDGIGDSYYYQHSYRSLVANQLKADLQKDFGWTMYNLLLIPISSNPQILLMVTSLITHSLYYLVSYKFRSYLELQLYLYITSGYYMVTMNGMRQCLAALLIFSCTYLIINGNFKKYLVFILLISTIHASALVMLPAYFIVRNKAWSRLIIILILITTMGVIFYSKLEPILFNLIKGTQYGHYSTFEEGGSSLIRTLINAVPVILAYIKRDTLQDKEQYINIFVNFSLINLVFVAMGMNNWIYNRFTLYFQLYNFILLPYLIKYCFNRKERRILYFGLVIFYFIFFYVETHMNGITSYSSNYLDFNGIFYYIK